MMNNTVPYSRHHPKWYRRRVSVWWWLESWRYAKFVLRELTSVAVAYSVVILLWKLRALAESREAYGVFLVRMQSPLFLVVNTLALVMVLYHAITWFNLTPKAMVVRLGGRRMPDWAVSGANYLAWIVISVFLAWSATRG
jgi:fumarate reductase subunit C